MSKTQEALKLALEEIKRVKAICLREAGIGLCNEIVIAQLEEALAEQPAQQQEVDWEKLYRLEVKKKEALAAKYERDTGKKLTRIVPMAEQPAQQQEPVAWRSWNDHDGYGFWETKQEAEPWCAPDFFAEPLYTSPPASKPLTPLLFSRRKAIADKLGVPMDATFNAIVRKVEAAHGITIEAAHGIKGDA